MSGDIENGQNNIWYWDKLAEIVFFYFQIAGFASDAMVSDTRLGRQNNYQK